MHVFQNALRARYASYVIAASALALTCACNTKDSPHNDSVVGQAGHLHIDDGGSGGLPVVFLHSFGGSTAHWTAELGRLRSERRAIAIDLRGHGESDAPQSNDFAIESLANDVEAAADALELEAFVLVGHSLGGAVAAAYAGEHPERVAGLMLIGTPGKSDPAMAEQVLSSLDDDFEGGMMQHTTSLLAGATPGVTARVRTEMARVPREQAMAIIDATFEFDPLPALRAYRGPIMLVDTPQGDGPNALHKQLPEIPHALINGSSHWPHLDKPAAFEPILDRLIADAEAAQ
jgi:pimeloyl-ACP methyl ester carboxylesterase